MNFLIWLKNLFAKKEPVKTWGDFLIRFACDECNYVAFDCKPRRCCPKCGGRKTREVVARRLTSVRNFDLGIAPMIIQHEIEIKGDA
jgi:rRNA maturation endonuclease Nob1